MAFDDKEYEDAIAKAVAIARKKHMNGNHSQGDSPKNGTVVPIFDRNSHPLPTYGATDEKRLSDAVKAGAKKYNCDPEVFLDAMRSVYWTGKFRD